MKRCFHRYRCGVHECSVAPLQLRWRPLAPSKAPLAAPRAASMPVRRPRRPPRRPAAVSAAVAAGADPDFSCAGELEPADRSAIRGKCALGWVCRPPLWVWWSSLVGGSISLIGLCLLGSSLRAGALGFIGTRNRTFCFSGPLRVCLSSRYLRPDRRDRDTTRTDLPGSFLLVRPHLPCTQRGSLTAHLACARHLRKKKKARYLTRG